VEPTLRSIAYVRNERRELVDDNWDDYVSTLELADDVPTASLRGLEEFSHVEIVFFRPTG
jgi:tRNA (Thr-GGU) A37 N-methylase